MNRIKPSPAKITKSCPDSNSVFTEREGPCSGCTSFLHSWNETAVNLQQKVSVVVTARSPMERLGEYKKRLRMDNLPFDSDSSGDYTRAYVSATDEDVPRMGIFTRTDGKIRHFYSSEISGEMADPGQDPCDPVDLDQVWLMLDLTREGRGADWYPKLDYGENEYQRITNLSGSDQGTP
jgi:predicted dithiol-disulfide oxidoreductase (DUF899 family)